MTLNDVGVKWKKIWYKTGKRLKLLMDFLTLHRQRQHYIDQLQQHQHEGYFNQNYSREHLWFSCQCIRLSSFMFLSYKNKQISLSAVLLKHIHLQNPLFVIRRKPRRCACHLVPIPPRHHHFAFHCHFLFIWAAAHILPQFVWLQLSVGSVGHTHIVHEGGSTYLPPKTHSHSRHHCHRCPGGVN